MATVLVYGAGIGGQQKHRHQYAKKKQALLTQVNPLVNKRAVSGDMEVRLEDFCEAEMDEQWSYVGKKSEPRWLWYAIDHATSTILAYVFGRRKDEVFKQLKA
jgi:hypothetical protein